MNDTYASPKPESIKELYDKLLNSGLSLAKIRDAVLANRLTQSNDDVAFGSAGRSLLWKLFLIAGEPLQSAVALNVTTLLSSLRSSRKAYAMLLSEKMRAPDGSYEDGFVVPELPGSPPKAATLMSNLETNNPLSLHAANPWREWFTAVELRKTILQDVERTFPDIAFFRKPAVQQQLTNILFLYSIMNPSIGYRQGMHELLAPLYYAIDYDSILPSGASDGENRHLEEILSVDWVAADGWALFDSVMRGASQWYEWQEPSALEPTRTLSPLRSHFQLNVPDGPLNARAYVAPIVETCNRIQGTLLRSTDPLLWKSMQNAEIEPQIYGIRWLRLLFTRELNMRDAMKLWDGLFVCDSTLELVPWICVAMLIRIRNELIPADYSGQLSVLLHYPPPPVTSSNHDHINLLLRQAQALRLSPTPTTGAAVVIENRNILQIPVEIPSHSPIPPASRGHTSRHKHPTSSAGRPSSAPNSSSALGVGHSRQQSNSQLGLPEMIARGLMERGESLGINKTFMTAVSELRRNIPEIAASLVRPPTTPSPSIPMEDEKPILDRPPWEPRTRFEMERDITQYRATNRKLGEALEWIVDVLLQDENEVQDKENLLKRRREAVESLSYVRDALLAGEAELDEERLIGDEETKRRTQKQHEAPQPRQFSKVVDIPAPVAAIPISAIDARAKQTADRHISPRHTLPGLPASSPTRPTFLPEAQASSSSSGLKAPWVYTTSSFSRNPTGLPSAALPRLPPAASARPEVAESHQIGHPARKEPRYDPLGALP